MKGKGAAEACLLVTSGKLLSVVILAQNIKDNTEQFQTHPAVFTTDLDKYFAVLYFRFELRTSITSNHTEILRIELTQTTVQVGGTRVTFAARVRSISILLQFLPLSR